ncbi:MAG: fasciclin domain-containing protein [Pseudomonadales bacterium]
MTTLRLTVAAMTLGLLAAVAQADNHAMDKQSNIVEVADKAGSFTTLIAALNAAGLAETLAGDGPFTVFAPTDAAFAALPEGTVESLLADKEALTKVLTYHVVAGKVGAADVAAMSPLTTLQGSTLTVGTDGGVTIQGAGVVSADVAASNGVIHVIDTVLIPQT